MSERGRSEGAKDKDGKNEGVMKERRKGDRDG